MVDDQRWFNKPTNPILFQAVEGFNYDSLGTNLRRAEF